MPELRPHAGPQQDFLSTFADIAIFGGAAGGGKSHALLLECARYTPSVKGFDAVIFRRTLADAKKPGGTIAKCGVFFGQMLGAKGKSDPIQWNFPNGGSVTIGHLEHEEDKLTWQSSEIALECFDELTHFTRSQFFYMLSRNRSMCGKRPYVRATTNPDADSWVAEFIAWWIDQDTGYPIPERAGKVRWMVVLDDEINWADSPEELKAQFGDEVLPKSVTFIPAKLDDNPTLVKADPGYRANLKALPRVERERLEGGNWKIRPAAGLLFQASWCEVIDAVPSGMTWVRYWDLAATKKTIHNDPDWTVGVKMGWNKETGIGCIAHVVRMRDSPEQVKAAVYNTATADERIVTVAISQDPAQAGKSQVQDYVKHLARFRVVTTRETGDKVTRFGPFSSQCEHGNVKIVRGSWNTAFLSSLEGFPDATHDDDADACSGAYNLLALGPSRKATVREFRV